MEYLDESPDGLAICGHNVLLVSVDNLIPLSSSQVVLWQVQVDLITIKVSIEGVAVGVMHSDDSLSLQHCHSACCIISDCLS